jgi:hypothetical protein
MNSPFFLFLWVVGTVVAGILSKNESLKRKITVQSKVQAREGGIAVLYVSGRLPAVR